MESAENAPRGTRAKLDFRKKTPDELEQSFHVAWTDTLQERTS